MYKCEKCQIELTNKGSLVSHQNSCKLTPEKIVEIKDKYLNDLYSIKELKIEYNLSSSIVERILKGITRSTSEARKIAIVKYPFKHSEESKQKLRIARLNYMKEHPENTAWRKSNMSYPEKLFNDELLNKEFDKKFLIERELSVFPYFIDFAFINEKLAIEIDGSQHLLEERKLKDEEKDKLLISLGWKVIRFSENEIKTNLENVFIKILEFIENSDLIYEKVGLLKHPKTKNKVFRIENELTEKEKQRAFNQRKVDRPNKEELLELIKNNSFTDIGKQFGVSDNAIRSWCKNYDLPFRKKDIKLL